MTGISLAVTMILVMFAFMAIRTPIAIAMFLSGSIGYVLQTGWLPYANFMNSMAFARFASYDLSVIPLFILMGQFATQGGISKALFEFTAAVVGRFRGGLAMAAVMASAAFGAICGSSVATAATITGVALPEMKRHGYSGRLATGALATAGTLGILIPPSVPLVIYAILTEQNIAKLFLAATVPGVLAMVGYMIVIAIYVRLVPGHAPELEENPPPFQWRTVLGLMPIAFVFLLVFGGIYGGFFSPTEGAAVGAASAFVAALLKREMSWRKFLDCFLATAESSAMIFLIFIGADVLNSALALTQIQSQLVSLINGWHVAPIWVMVGIVILHILLGTVTEELSIVLLTIPIFFPVVMSLDFGMAKEPLALWFGILILMVISFGMLVPPMGLNVYVVNGMAKGVPLAESFRGVLPFLVSDFVRIALMLAFPGIALWLVRFMS
ncbi:TRAP transporter large permease [Ramlibacter ginsenosidimutans]|uniref:TRAP transporter large permease protein n=1 Tax=Ramlibacter ginsenosidimutans TaxID=502333 RepID=A0A934TUY1_9BURK|nr:TRAP transporter large permease [Ramlibacter ginsenosidimutans]MBK6007486.1 TRAP transporter large permease [Ramlibacter ginsenosidimutans]